jgi:hypothetical protein
MGEGASFGAERALRLMRIMRAGILVLCLAGAAAAWVAGSPTVLGLALVIAAEEMWECSVVVAALRRESRGAPLPLRWSAPALPRHRS